MHGWRWYDAGGAGRTISMQTDIRRLLQANGIKLGAAQRRRLEWLAGSYGTAVMQTGAEMSAGDSGVIIVAEPPSGARAELLCRTLHAGCVVAIPFGENPAFDFFKSKLIEFGTVGPWGDDGPHELWWGGVKWPTRGLNGMSSLAPPRIISCYRPGIDDAY